MSFMTNIQYPCADLSDIWIQSIFLVVSWCHAVSSAHFLGQKKKQREIQSKLLSEMDGKISKLKHLKEFQGNTYGQNTDRE